MQASLYRHKTPLALLFVLTLAALAPASTARAQALPGASRKADIGVFGAYTRSNPDYGAFNNNGVVVGADYTRYIGWRISPAIEIRANRTSGYALTQETILAGLKLKTDFNRFHPYADALVGGGKILFKFPITPRYTQDTAMALSFGGGVDVDLYRGFQLKVDYQQQFENFGPNGTRPNNGDFTLAPTFFSVGVAYRVPARARKR